MERPILSPSSWSSFVCALECAAISANSGNELTITCVNFNVRVSDHYRPGVWLQSNWKYIDWHPSANSVRYPSKRHVRFSKIYIKKSILLIAEGPLCVYDCVSYYSSKTTGSFELKFGVHMYLTHADVLNYVLWHWPQGQGHSEVNGRIYVYSNISVNFEIWQKC